MDRAMLEQHLAQAKAHIAQGIEHLARQREIIDRLQVRGLDTASAIELLRLMEESQAAHVADRDRIVEELARAD